MWVTDWLTVQMRVTDWLYRCVWLTVQMCVTDCTDVCDWLTVQMCVTDCTDVCDWLTVQMRVTDWLTVQMCVTDWLLQLTCHVYQLCPQFCLTSLPKKWYEILLKKKRRARSCPTNSTRYTSIATKTSASCSQTSRDSQVSCDVIQTAGCLVRNNTAVDVVLRLGLGVLNNIAVDVVLRLGLGVLNYRNGVRRCTVRAWM